MPRGDDPWAVGATRWALLGEPRPVGAGGWVNTFEVLDLDTCIRPIKMDDAGML